MYAVISDGGRQYRVEEGQTVQLDYRDLSSGAEIEFNRILAYGDDNGSKFGSPLLEGALVKGEVVGVAQGPKLVVQKLRRRKTLRRKTGHRQLHINVKINKVQLG